MPTYNLKCPQIFFILKVSDNLIFIIIVKYIVSFNIHPHHQYIEKNRSKCLRFNILYKLKNLYRLHFYFVLIIHVFYP